MLAFTKLYGYVRYFHPSDEASSINWEKFAAYGCYKVENCTSEDELLEALKNLFLPIAPTLKIFKKSEKHVSFDTSSLIPSLEKGRKIVAWQYLGVNFGYDFGSFQSGSVYKSIRTNRPPGTFLFKYHPQLGEHTVKKIGRGIEVLIPIALYDSSQFTYPRGNREDIEELI